MITKTVLIITILLYGESPVQIVDELQNMDLCIYKAEEVMKTPLNEKELARSATCGLVRSKERES